MITPALPRWYADLLADPTSGVNVIAPTVPRRVADPAPPAVGVFNSVDDAWVARGHVDDEATPDEWVLFVGVAEEMQLAGDPGDGALEDTATVVISLHGATIDADNAATLAQAYRLMRAVRRVLITAFVAQQMDVLVLEGQQITLPSQLQGITLDSKPGSGQVALAIALPHSITDTWALGAEETP